MFGLRTTCRVISTMRRCRISVPKRSSVRSGADSASRTVHALTRELQFLSGDLNLQLIYAAVNLGLGRLETLWVIRLHVDRKLTSDAQNVGRYLRTVLPGSATKKSTVTGPSLVDGSARNK